MKDKFRGHYRPSEDEFRTLWQTCLFAFDTSVLLNLYSYSEKTRLVFLKILADFRDRIWLPYQAAYEYHTNRLSSVSKEAARYTNLGDALQDVAEQLKSGKQHPFLADRTFEQFSQIVEQIKKELRQGQAAHEKLISDDPILAELTSLFDGRIGDAYPETRLSEIYNEGNTRYEKNVPPGYMDKKKPGHAAYGDLLIWREVLDKAKKDKTPVILVSDDNKEDWWQIHKGVTIGPRPELRHEMMAEAAVEFYMYHSDTFMQRATDYLKSEVDHKAIEEVETARAARRDEAKRFQGLFGVESPFITAKEVYPESVMQMVEKATRESEAATRAVDFASRLPGLAPAELAALRKTLREQASEMAAVRSMLRCLPTPDLTRQVMESQGLSEDDACKWICRQFAAHIRPASTPEDAAVDDGEGPPIRD